MGMYFLVKFEDGIHYICSESRILFNNKIPSVKYRGGAWYSATVVASNNDKTVLATMKTELEKEELIEVNSGIENETNNEATNYDCFESADLLHPHAAIVRHSNIATSITDTAEKETYQPEITEDESVNFEKGNEPVIQKMSKLSLSNSENPLLPKKNSTNSATLQESNKRNVVISGNVELEKNNLTLDIEKSIPAVAALHENPVLSVDELPLKDGCLILDFQETMNKDSLDLNNTNINCNELRNRSMLSNENGEFILSDVSEIETKTEDEKGALATTETELERDLIEVTSEVRNETNIQATNYDHFESGDFLCPYAALVENSITATIITDTTEKKTYYPEITEDDTGNFETGIESFIQEMSKPLLSNSENPLLPKEKSVQESDKKNPVVILSNYLICDSERNGSLRNVDIEKNELTLDMERSIPAVVPSHENHVLNVEQLPLKDGYLILDFQETMNKDSFELNYTNTNYSQIRNRSIFSKENGKFILSDVSEIESEKEAEQQTLQTKKLAKRVGHKQHSCFFCKKVLFQLPRHWFKVHFKEPAVREIMELNEKNFLRRKKIDDLRKKGDFNYNQLSDRENIVMRNGSVGSTKYRPCPSCLGYFSKDNLRHHKQKCSPKRGDRSLQGNSIKLTNYIHARASEMLRNQIAPNMYKDEVSNNFLFDEILIVYGNFLCIKYTESHLKTHIRAQLRLLGRFMLQAKIIDPNIRCCKDLMHPSCIDTVRKSIDVVAGLNHESGIYKHPTNARTLSTEFKKILEVVLSECDKNEDECLRKTTKAMTRRYNLELAPYINRICKLSENRFNRLKEVNNLPENKEVEDYLEYLTRGADLHLNNLKIKYAFDDWNKLCQYILVALAVFNRKRPGETQRIELEDFNKRECVSEKDIINLTEHEKIQADKYIRVAFRGKLGNTTALLIDKNRVLPSLEIIIKYRLKAGVHPENPYLFGFPSIDKYKTYNTYRCNRQFLEESGMNQTSLTFTNLRKHFATQVAKEGPSHEQELRISNYMSHKYSIHKTVYDQSTPIVDITTVSQCLERSAKNKRKKSESRVQNKNTDTNMFKRTPAETKGELKSVAREQIKGAANSDIEDEEYLPESGSEEDELDQKLMESYLGKFKSRKLWSSEEKQVTRTYFIDELANGSCIPSDKIRELKSKYNEILKNRSVPMIKQWLKGEQSKMKGGGAVVNAKRSRYSSPEREILEKSTEQHSLDGTEPSLEELDELIDKHDILKHRSSDSLLRKFRYMKRRSKECEGDK